MIVPNDPWFGCLPSCEAHVPCGQGRHIVRWEAGTLRLAGHADPEAELVLAALGGEKARCVELAEAWSRHTEDLSVLAIGPRGPADEIVVSWDDVDAAAQRGVRAGDRPGPVRGPRQLASPSIPTAARAQTRQQQDSRERERAARRRNDMLSLLALGYGFQVRLIGQVAQAYADRPDESTQTETETVEAVTGVTGVTEVTGATGVTVVTVAMGVTGVMGTMGVAEVTGAMGVTGVTGVTGITPALVAAIAGRLAPVAEEWLGIDPDQVVVSLHRGRGWGSVELTGQGEQLRLRASLPTGWLARVWAAGLALTGRHLVVAVERAGWPDARVLALRAPGTEPVPLDVHASQPGPVSGGRHVRPTAADAPHWEV